MLFTISLILSAMAAGLDLQQEAQLNLVTQTPRNSVPGGKSGVGILVAVGEGMGVGEGAALIMGIIALGLMLLAMPRRAIMNENPKAPTTTTARYLFTCYS
jgi:hypothetical protein